MVYAFDAEPGKLIRPIPTSPRSRWRPGAGPRQLVIAPNGRFAYLINELNSTMTAYATMPRTGALTELQILPTLPADFTGDTSCAEVQITPAGRFLYGSNRGHDSLAIYAIDPDDGLMTAVGWERPAARSRATSGRSDRALHLRRQPGHATTSSCSGSTRRPAS